MRRRERGMTLMEVMISTAILAGMMTLAWATISNTQDARETFESFELRNHEMRMAMGRVIADLEAAYLSKNEDQNNTTYPRTMFIAKGNGKSSDIRFSTLGHRVLWADANESDQTVIQYLAHNNPEHPGETDWVRREQRRPSNLQPSEEAADYDILVHDIAGAKLEFWNWKNSEWQATWDTTQIDGQKGFLPSRVRITLTTKGPDDKEYKVMTEARIWMQEVLNFSQQ